MASSAGIYDGERRATSLLKLHYVSKMAEAVSGAGSSPQSHRASWYTTSAISTAISPTTASMRAMTSM
ncbi:MAG: hypothetical protein IMW89_21230 [Ktedonobacteraceae bacterium]|nr:hypothetical protein [Ktedonobacteraceae bacterium]